MKELIDGLKSVLRADVKDLYQYQVTEINIMLFDTLDLDFVYEKTERYVLKLTGPYTLAKINFIDGDEQVLKSITLVQ
ncbi:hypothetical protein [Pedobacter sp.]|uniref:hypothetical protein n=1 Tax=Pedobacter sp. TaxID=1411316 RepID=UPI003BA8F3C5